MKKQISKSAFKAQALEIMRGVEESGEEYVITAHGKKTLVLKPYQDHEISPRQKLKGSVLSYDEPFSPVAEDDWELS
jgi:antitoxin (DNA-binding transcriptional repressor) of toxin-antitoxin stability system